MLVWERRRTFLDCEVLAVAGGVGGTKPGGLKAWLGAGPGDGAPPYRVPYLVGVGTLGLPGRSGVPTSLSSITGSGLLVLLSPVSLSLSPVSSSLISSRSSDRTFSSAFSAFSEFSHGATVFISICSILNSLGVISFIWKREIEIMSNK